MSRIFGAIRQNGYVVRDIEAAMQHWTQKLGVGPFFYIEKVPVEQPMYNNEPSDIDVSIALSNSGPLQIELIQQRNDAPSTYLDFLNAGHEGLQHVAYWTEAMDDDLTRIAAAGYEIAQSGCIGEGGRFVYYRTEAHPGTIVELSEISGMKGKYFKMIEEAANGWDGQSEAIVRVEL